MDGAEGAHRGEARVTTRKAYKVMGMTCGGCASSVTRALSARFPDSEPEVRLREGIVLLSGEPPVEQVRGAVEEAGFDFGGAVD